MESSTSSILWSLPLSKLASSLLVSMYFFSTSWGVCWRKGFSTLSSWFWAYVWSKERLSSFDILFSMLLTNRLTLSKKAMLYLLWFVICFPLFFINDFKIILLLFVAYLNYNPSKHLNIKTIFNRNNYTYLVHFVQENKKVWKNLSKSK